MDYFAKAVPLSPLIYISLPLNVTPLHHIRLKKVHFFSVPSREAQASWPTLQELTDSLQPDPTCSLHQEWDIL